MYSIQFLEWSISTMPIQPAPPEKNPKKLCLYFRGWFRSVYRKNLTVSRHIPGIGSTEPNCIHCFPAGLCEGPIPKT